MSPVPARVASGSRYFVNPSTRRSSPAIPRRSTRSTPRFGSASPSAASAGADFSGTPQSTNSTAPSSGSASGLPPSRQSRTNAAARCSSSFARCRSVGGRPPWGWRNRLPASVRRGASRRSSAKWAASTSPERSAAARRNPLEWRTSRSWARARSGCSVKGALLRTAVGAPRERGARRGRDHNTREPRVRRPTREKTPRAPGADPR